MSITKYEDLPFSLDEIVKVKVKDIEKDIMSFIHRTRTDESVYSVKIPKNKIWKNADFLEGSKIKISLTTSKFSKKIQLTIHY